MHKIKLITLILLAILFSCNSEKPKEKNCSILHEGTFKYGPKIISNGEEFEVNNNAIITFKGNNHTELYEEGKYYIKSNVEWINECEYKATVKEVKFPNSELDTGTVMYVKILETKENETFYSATAKGKSWKGTMIKQ